MNIDERIEKLRRRIESIDLADDLQQTIDDQMKSQTLKDQLEGQLVELETYAVDDETREKWKIVCHCLQGIGLSGEDISALPRIHDVELQKNRIRLEATTFVRRQCYDGYEETFLLSRRETNVRMFGLIGPQGFGKTGLLRYLHAKYAFADHYLVIHVTSFKIHNDDGNFTRACRDIRRSFYWACSLRELEFVDISRISSLSDLIQRIRHFAERKELTLLIMLDQLQVVADFRRLFEEINSGLANSKRRHTVIVSSSTSRTSKDVFEAHVHQHVRFQNFTSEAEAQALAVPGVAAKDLTAVSFLEAIRLTRPGAEKSIAEEAKLYEQEWLATASDKTKAEHMFVFHSVLSQELFNDDNLVLSEKVDADAFFWHVNSRGHRQIREKRPGLAKLLLQQLKKEKQNYVEYLRLIVDSEYFSWLPQRTKGNILEDCIAAILSDKRQAAQFQATKFDGNPTNPKTLQLPCDRNFINFDTASLADIEFRKGLVIVALPNDPDYTSVDFVVIHQHEERKAKLWFIQCTVSDPKSHGCRETENFQNWISALNEQNLDITHKRLVFLTSNATPVSDLQVVPSALKNSEVLHCNFTTTDGMTGNHVLIETLKKPGTFE